MKNTTQKPNIFLRIAGLLLMLVLITACLVPGLYARYITTADGTDSARVAKFDVSITPAANNPTDMELSLLASSATYIITVSSASEVAVEYDVVLTLPTTLPDVISLTINGKTPTQNGNKYTFEKVGEIAVGGASQELILTVAVTDFKNIENEINLNGITVEVIARQKD